MSLQDYKLVERGKSFLVVKDGVTVGEVYEARGMWCGNRSNTKRTELHKTRAEASKWVAGCHMMSLSGLTA